MQSLKRSLANPSALVCYRWAILVLLLIPAISQADEPPTATPQEAAPQPSSPADPHTEEATPPETGKTPWPDAIPPLQIQSEDGQHTLCFGMVLQLLLLHQRNDLSSNERHSELKIRRLRFNLRGNLFGKDLSYRVQLSAAPDQLEIIDYYLSYRVDTQAILQAGNFKLPFNRFRLFSATNLQSVDWPILTKIFGSERQIGFMVHNDLGKPKPFEYAIGLFDGMNSRKSNALGMSRLMGEPVGNPSSLTDPAPLDDLHPNLVARFAWNVNDPNGKMATDWSRGGFRSSLGLGLTLDPFADRREDFALRLAPEWLVQVQGFGMIVGYYLGFYRSDNKLDQTSLAWHGAVAQASYLFNRWVELAASYAVVASTEKARDEARLRADERIAKAADEDAQSLSDQYKKVGQSLADHEAALGLNIYLIGRSLKIQTDAGMAFHQQRQGEMVKDLLLRCQFTLVL